VPEGRGSGGVKKLRSEEVKKLKVSGFNSYLIIDN